MLRNTPSAKYLVLYISPYDMPLYYKQGFSPSLYRAFVSPFRFVDMLPSLGFRIAILNSVYYGHYSHFFWGTDPNNPNLMGKWEAQYPKTNGWVPVPDSPNRGIDIPTGECVTAYLTDAEHP